MTSRHALRLTGTDRYSFLQGLVSNNVTPQMPLTYAALLTPQGKYLADFFVFEDEDALMIDVAAPFAPDLAKRLNMYRLRADVQVTDSPLEVACGTGPAPKGAMDDPRHAAMGWRHYGAQSANTDNWASTRVAHLIPESGVELIPNETFILEAGFERLNGVDFRKGCYVGQEVTARMKHKTELKKGLARVSISGSAPVGTAITANEKPAGTLFTQANGEAIAYLRFDRAGGDMQAGDARLAMIAPD